MNKYSYLLNKSSMITDIRWEDLTDEQRNALIAIIIGWIVFIVIVSIAFYFVFRFARKRANKLGHKHISFLKSKVSNYKKQRKEKSDETKEI